MKLTMKKLRHTVCREILLRTFLLFMLHGPIKTMSVLSWPRGELRVWNEMLKKKHRRTKRNTGVSPVYSINSILPLHSVPKSLPFIQWTALSLIVKSPHNIKLIAVHSRYRCHTLDKHTSLPQYQLECTCSLEGRSPDHFALEFSEALAPPLRACRNGCACHTQGLGCPSQ